jgi:aspartyl/asparaginyl-tRNA synthetase
MFLVITNIYNKKNQRIYLNGTVHSHRENEKVFFLQLEMFNVCTTGDTAYIDSMLKFLPHTRQHGCRVTRGVHIEHL